MNRGEAGERIFMARPRQLTHIIVCAALAIAVCASAAVATTASSKRKHPRRVTCAVHRPRKRRARHPARPARRTRPVHHTKRKQKVVRCTSRVKKRQKKKPIKRPVAHPAPVASSHSTAPTTASAASTGAASTPSATPGAAPGLNVGVVTSVGRSSDQVSRMGQIESKSGAKWLREMFDWSMIEPRNGTYDFGHYDSLMTLASQNGVQVVPLCQGEVRQIRSMDY